MSVCLPEAYFLFEDYCCCYLLFVIRMRWEFSEMGWMLDSLSIFCSGQLCYLAPLRQLSQLFLRLQVPALWCILVTCSFSSLALRNPEGVISSFRTSEHGVIICILFLTDVKLGVTNANAVFRPLGFFAVLNYFSYSRMPIELWIIWFEDFWRLAALGMFTGSNSLADEKTFRKGLGWHTIPWIVYACWWLFLALSGCYSVSP